MVGRAGMSERMAWIRACAQRRFAGAEGLVVYGSAQTEHWQPTMGSDVDLLVIVQAGAPNLREVYQETCTIDPEGSGDASGIKLDTFQLNLQVMSAHYQGALRGRPSPYIDMLIHGTLLDGHSSAVRALWDRARDLPPLPAAAQAGIGERSHIENLLAEFDRCTSLAEAIGVAGHLHHTLARVHARMRGVTYIKQAGMHRLLQERAPELHQALLGGLGELIKDGDGRGFHRAVCQMLNALGGPAHAPWKSVL